MTDAMMALMKSMLLAHAPCATLTHSLAHSSTLLAGGLTCCGCGVEEWAACKYSLVSSRLDILPLLSTEI